MLEDVGIIVPSLFYYEPGGAVWKQVWVTEQALAPGGLEEKRLIETLAGGAVRLQGEDPSGR